MKILKIYDPDTSGSIDTTAELDQFLNNLDKCTVKVDRLDLSQDPEAYTQEPVAGLLKEKGADALPLVMIDDEVISIGEYPDLGKLTGLLQTSKLPFGMPDCSACRGCD